MNYDIKTLKTCVQCVFAVINSPDYEAGIPGYWTECDAPGVCDDLFQKYTEDELPSYCGMFKYRDTE